MLILDVEVIQGNSTPFLWLH